MCLPSPARPRSDLLPIVLGVGLPVLVVVFFVLATWIPRQLVEPPGYDLLFTAAGGRWSEDPRPVGLAIQVVDERLRVRAYPIGSRARGQPALYRFDHQTGETREVSFELPLTLDAEERDGREIPVPELDRVRIDTSRRAPDGWEYREPGDGGGVFELFFSPRRRSPSIARSGAVVRLEPDPGRSWGWRFLGWVVPEADEA